jgi:hypothetical protein
VVEEHTSSYLYRLGRDGLFQAGGRKGLYTWLAAVVRGHSVGLCGEITTWVLLQLLQGDDRVLLRALMKSALEIPLTTFGWLGRGFSDCVLLPHATRLLSTYINWPSGIGIEISNNVSM